MTALNSYLSPDAVLVMTDTLMTTDTGHPAAFVAKTYPVPQINALISGRGDSRLISGFAYAVTVRMLVADYDMLVDLAPEALRQLWAEFEGERTATASVFVWGWSPEQGRFAGAVFRSGDDFEPDPMQDGTRFAPGLDDEAMMEECTVAEKPVATMLQVMIAAAEESRAKPNAHDRCHIGGEVVLHTMTNDDAGRLITSSEIIHYFGDRDEQYAQALSLLQA